VVDGRPEKLPKEKVTGETSQHLDGSTTEECPAFISIGLDSKSDIIVKEKSVFVMFSG